MSRVAHLRIAGAARPAAGRLSPATLLVAGLALALALAGLFFAADMLRRGAAPGGAPIGAQVRLPGGWLRVDSVTPEHMAPMNLAAFNRFGMNMSQSMGMDMPAEGDVRFAVGLTLAAEAPGGMRYDLEQFRVIGAGMEDAAPVRSNVAVLSETLAPGTAIRVGLVFDAPETATDLRLVGPGLESPIMLGINPSTVEGHEH